MSRRRRNRSHQPQTPSGPQASGPNLRAFNLSGYEAANPSRRRGWIPWTTLDSSRMLTGYDRKAILKNANWAFANIGLARRIVNGLANLVGYLTPQAATKDKEWNTLAEQLFRERAGFAPVFDRAGKLNFFTWQIAATRARLRDGDMLTVLSETDSGGIARVIVYESAQVDDGQQSTDKPENLRDGVYTDKFGRHTGYRLVNSSDPSIWTQVPASDAIFHADFERPGQTRGVSALAHALIHIQDRAEVWGDVKHAIKVAAQIAIYKKKEKPTPYPGYGFGGNPRETADVGTTTSGSTATNNIEKVYGSGYLDDSLAEGESYDLLHDDRPHPNQREFLEDLVRDIAWGVGVAPEILWQLAGQTGPNTRYLMAELQRWIGQQQTLQVEPACQRFWVYFIAKELKAGRLPFPKNDDAWWRCDWVPQADMTIDRGREGKLQLDQLRMGATNFSDVWKSNGGDFETGFDKQLAALTTAREKAKAAGFELHEIMPGFFDKPAPEPASVPAPAMQPD